MFCYERTRSTPLDPKLIFWCISYYLGAFGTVCLPCRSRCKTGQTSAKVRATKSCRNFSQRTRPIHPFGPLPHVLVHFILFGCIWDCLVALRKSVQKWAELVQKFVPRSRIRIFRNEHTGSIPLDPKQMFWCVSYYLGAFSQRKYPIHPVGL